MAEQTGNCPRCGHSFEVEAGAERPAVCPSCQSPLVANGGTEEAEGIPAAAAGVEPLSAVLEREGPLRGARAVPLLKDVASALAAVHDAGTVHGDIKPSSILIDATGSARVTDSGLAKPTEGGEPSLSTVLHMAPEVASGMAANASSDLYSLGATFYHALAGRPPHEGQTAAELTLKQVSETPPRLRQVAPHVSHSLADVIDRLIAKSPKERYPSARALVEDLEAIAPLRHGAPATEAVTARATPPSQAPAEAVTRHGQMSHRDDTFCEEGAAVQRPTWATVVGILGVISACFGILASGQTIEVLGLFGDAMEIPAFRSRATATGPLGPLRTWWAIGGYSGMCVSVALLCTSIGLLRARWWSIQLFYIVAVTAIARGVLLKIALENGAGSAMAEPFMLVAIGGASGSLFAIVTNAVLLWVVATGNKEAFWAAP